MVMKYSTSFVKPLARNDSVKQPQWPHPHYFHPRCRCSGLTSEDTRCNPFLRGDRLIVPASRKKPDPRLSCVNHNLSLISSYKTWTPNSQTDLLRLRPLVGNLFPSVIRIGAVIVTGRCLTKWNHTFIYFLRTWFNVTFDSFLFSWAWMNYGWWILVISNSGFWRFSGTEIHDLETVKLSRITPWWSRNILISYNSL